MPETISTVEPLAQLLQSIMRQKRTGVVRIEQIGERYPQQGEMYFEQGRLMRAQVVQETGTTALQHISTWKQITCSFYSMNRPFPLTTAEPMPVSEPQTEKNRALRRLPESRQQTGKIPVAHSQTEQIARLPEPSATRDLQQERGQPSPALEPNMTRDLREERAQPVSIPKLTSQPVRWLEEAQQSMRQRAMVRPIQGQVARDLQESGPLPALLQEEGRSVAHIRMSFAATRVDQPLVLHGDTLEEYTPEQSVKPSLAAQRWTRHVAPQAGPLNAPLATPHLAPVPPRALPPASMAIFKAKTLAATSQAIQGMERRERLVFILLDGRRTIRDIARLTHQEESAVEDLLVRLSKDGYIYYVRG